MSSFNTPDKSCHALAQRSHTFTLSTIPKAQPLHEFDQLPSQRANWSRCAQTLIKFRLNGDIETVCSFERVPALDFATPGQWKLSKGSASVKRMRRPREKRTDYGVLEIAAFKYFVTLNVEGGAKETFVDQSTYVHIHVSENTAHI